MSGRATRAARIFICGLISFVAPANLLAAEANSAIDVSPVYLIQNEVVTQVAYNGSAGDLNEFYAALRQRESSGNYRAINTLNFIGAYQFGEAALIDLGYVRPDRDIYDNNFGGGFTGKNGIRSVQDFLNSPAVQDHAADEWMHVMWRYIRADGLDRYAWTEVGGIVLSPSGMLAATHLLGTGGLRQFVDSRGRADIRDPYGMPLRNYIEDLGGYEIPFGPVSPVTS